MPSPEPCHLDIEIDHLTNSIRSRLSGESFDTSLELISSNEITGITKKDGWNFNWKSEARESKRQVYKLIISNQPEIIQGLVSIEDKGDHFYLHLAESAPLNFGPDKIHEGVGGNLFAFCCKRSWDSGYEGIIAFKAKTTLLSHYRISLGALDIGNHNMIIYPEKALILLNKYFSK